jgi:uncharacterized protein with FMN-binding domain
VGSLLLAVIVLLAAAPVASLADDPVADGVYTLSLTVMHAVSAQLSMADSAVNKDTVKLTVEEGRARLSFALKPLSVGALTGYLGELYVGSNYRNESGVISMDTSPAAVSSYHDVTDAFNDPETGTDARMKGKSYPKDVSIPVVLGEGTTWIQVYVPIMEAIQPGSGSQYARVVLDWSALVSLDDPEPTGYVPGIYSGVGQGYADNPGGADIQVFVQTSESEIVKIFAGAHNQTAQFWNMAFGGAYGVKSVPAQILEKQSVDGVDVVSGATLSSGGIKQAVAAALVNAAAGTAATPDETLTVPAALWNANADQPSMMNGMLIPTAEVRKYGAEYTAVFQVGPTSIYGIAVSGGQSIVAENCVFIGNQAKTGSGLLLSAGALGSLTGVTVIGSVPSTDAGAVCKDANLGQTGVTAAVTDGGNNLFGTLYSNAKLTDEKESSVFGGIGDESAYTAERWEALQTAIATAKAEVIAGGGSLAAVIAAQSVKLRAAIAAPEEEDPNAATYTKENLQRRLDTAGSLRESLYTPESWAALQAAAAQAQSVLAEAGAPASKIGAAIGGLQSAIFGLVLVSGSDPGDAYPELRVSIAGPESARPGQPVRYVVSVRDASALAAVRVRYTYDEAALRFVSAQGQSGAAVLAEEDGGVTVSWLDGTEGLTADEATPVIVLNFVVKEDVSGAAAVKIEEVEAASYPSVGLRVAPADPDTARTEFYGPYDFNRDGRTNLADLAWAQGYYRAKADDTGWETAKAADVDGNGTVNVGDYILILEAITGE